MIQLLKKEDIENLSKKEKAIYIEEISEYLESMEIVGWHEERQVPFKLTKRKECNGLCPCCDNSIDIYNFNNFIKGIKDDMFSIKKNGFLSTKDLYDIIDSRLEVLNEKKKN